MTALQCVAACKRTFPNHSGLSKHKKTCKFVNTAREKHKAYRNDSIHLPAISTKMVSDLSDRKARLAQVCILVL